MKHLVVGTAGHIDHGKTSLVKALTGIDTDRLKEEKARGITIELGFAHLDLPGDIRLGIVDVPGHERFVRAMVAGVGGIDFVMLVIAADEGVMPQTREHLDICRLLGVSRGVVVLTKTDMVDADWLGLVTEEVRDYLAGSFLDGAAIVPVSSRSGSGIDALREGLAQLARSVTVRGDDGPFRLPVDRVFTMPGFGTVVTGTLWTGTIRVGDAVELLPSGRTGRVRGIQVYGHKEERGGAGQRVAVNLQGIDHDEVARGQVLVPPGRFRATRTVDVSLHSLASARTLKHRATLRLHSGTTETPAQVILPDRENLNPGETAPAQLRLRDPLLLLPGDPFVLRSFSPALTVGGGQVLDPAPPRRRRRSQDAALLLDALGGDDAAATIRLLVAEGRLSGIPADEVAFRSGLSGAALDGALGALLSRGEIVLALREPRCFLSREAFTTLAGGLLTALASYLKENPLREGMGKEELKGQLPRRSDPRFFGGLLAALAKEKKVVVDRDMVKLAAGSGEAALPREVIPGEIVALLQASGTEPPTVKELVERFKLPEKTLIEHLSRLVREGAVVRVAGDLYYAPETLAGIRELLVAYLRENGEIIPSRFRELTGLSRKFMIPVLEYFDSIKVTIRVGDKRLLRRG